MRGDAIRVVLASLVADVEPTDAETSAAVVEAVDIALAFFANVERASNAIESLFETVDGDLPRITDAVMQIAAGDDDEPLGFNPHSGAEP